MSNTHSELMLEASEAAYALGVFHDFDGIGGYKIDTSFNPGEGGNGQLTDPTTGFRVIAYVNPETNERILTFTGSQGLQDAFQDLKVGWDQWLGDEPASSNREPVLAYMRDHATDGPIHLTGHSLGGALAQYAAYEYMDGLTELERLDAKITLTTFNAPGGYFAINEHYGGGPYDPAIMANLDTDAIRHYWADGDLVSHLGDGHVGGNTYKIEFGGFVPKDFIEAYVLETVGPEVDRQGGIHDDIPEAPDYLFIPGLQKAAVDIGFLFNDIDADEPEAVRRLVAAVVGAVTIAQNMPDLPGDSEYDLNGQLAGLISVFAQNWRDAHVDPQADPVMYATLTEFSNVHKLSKILRRLPKQASILGGAITSSSLLGAWLGDILELQEDYTDIPADTIEQFMQESFLNTAPVIRDFKDIYNVLASDMVQSLLGVRLDISISNLQVTEGESNSITISLGEDYANRGGTSLLIRISDPHLLRINDSNAPPVGGANGNGADSGLYIAQFPSGVNSITVVVDALDDDDASPDFSLISIEFPPYEEELGEAFNQGIIAVSDVDIADDDVAQPPRPNTGGAVQSGYTHYDVGSGMPQFINPAPAEPELLADGGNNHIIAFEEGDFIRGQGGDDIIEGSGNVDVLVGDAGQDRLFSEAEITDLPAYLTQTESGQGSGEQGDWLAGGQDKDVLVGLAGDDVLFGGSGADMLIGGLGDDVLTGDDHYLPVSDSNTAPDEWTVSDSINPFGKLFSTVHVEEVPALGVNHDDTLYGGAGNDSIAGQLGNDVAYGGDGNDYLSGWEGNDRLYGGEGDDYITGEFHGASMILQELDPDATYTADDYLNGGAGNDHLWGEEGDDVLIGGSGDDELQGDLLKEDGNHPEQGNDLLFGGAGKDRLFGQGGDDLLDGGAGDDILRGDSDNGLDGALHGLDTLYGGEGNDNLNGGGFGDILYGDAGDDVLIGDSGDSQYHGNDTLYGGSGEDQLAGRGGNDDLYGGDDNDLLQGDDGNDLLNGGAGDDGLSGGAGDDILIGGEGKDQLAGGEGNDTYYLGAGDIMLDEAGEGDTVYFDIALGDAQFTRLENGSLVITSPNLTEQITIQDWFNGDSVENLVFSDGLADNAVIQQTAIIVGTNGDDILHGNQGDNTIHGIAGNDQLWGEAGNDTLLGDNPGAPAEEQGNDQLYGGEGDDILYGRGGDDQLDGGSGNDYLLGEAGSDNYLINLKDGKDIIIDDDNKNRITMGQGIASSDIKLSQSGDHLLITFVGATDQVTVANWFTNNNIQTIQFEDGSSYDVNQILAEVAANQGQTIEGTTGDDVLQGGAGNDLLAGGMGNDTYHFELGGGRDTIDENLPSGGIPSGGVISTGDDTLVFGAGITPDQLTAERVDRVDGGLGNQTQTGDLYIYVNTDDVVIIKDWFSDATIIGNTTILPPKIEHIEFADGTVWDLPQINQFIAGEAINYAPVVNTEITDQATEVGQAFNFTIPADTFTDPEGGALTYSATLSDGSPLPDWLSFDAATGAFSGTANMTDLRSLRFNYKDWYREPLPYEAYLNINITTEDNDGLQVSDDFVLNISLPDPTIGSNSASILSGTVQSDYLLGSTLHLGGVKYYGREGNDFLNGTVYSDGDSNEYYGGDGDDYILGGSGHEILDGGKGADLLIGGGGNDRYMFSIGDDNNSTDVTRIIDYDGGTILFSEGIAFEDVVFERVGDDLDVHYSQNDVFRIVGGAADIGSTYQYEFSGNGNTVVTSDYVNSVINSSPANTDPAAINDFFTSPENQGVNFSADSLLLNDTDVDGDNLSIAGVTNAVNGRLFMNDGNITFFPIAYYNGPASFDYIVTDGNGGIANATVNIELTPVNDAPFLANSPGWEHQFNTGEFSSLDINANGTAFADLDNDQLSYSANLQNGDPLPAWLDFDPDTQTFSGTPVASDEDRIIVNVVATDPSGESVDRNIFLTIGTPTVDWGSVLVDFDNYAAGDYSNLSDHGMQFQMASSSPIKLVSETGGNQAITLISGDTLQINRTGTFDLERIAFKTGSGAGSIQLVGTAAGGGSTRSYTLNYSGAQLIPVDFDSGWASLGSVEITVTGSATVLVDDLQFGDYSAVPSVNALPQAVADSVTGIQDQYLSIAASTLQGNDNGNYLRILRVYNAENGIVSLEDNGRNIIFRPDPGYAGPASFEYSTGDFRDVSTALVSIDIVPDGGAGPVNTAPQAIADTLTGNEDQALTITAASLLANDTDADGEALSITAVNNAIHGTVSMDGNGDIVFTPEANYNGPASFDYNITDGQGGTANATVSIDVAAINDAPTLAQVLTDQIASEGNAFSYTLAANSFTDLDGDALTYSASLADGSPLPTWLNFDAATQTISGTPASGDVGNLDLLVTATDPSGESVSDSFSLDVSAAPNTTPQAIADTLTGTEDQLLTITAASLLANDSDADGDTLSITAVNNATHGTVTLDGNGDIVFTPEANYNGPASFDYSITDGQGGTASANVIIDIAASNAQIGTSGNDVMRGTALADTLDGGAGNDRLFGRDGDDTLIGGEGNDRLYGDGGSDSMEGGVGNDYYYVDNAGDSVIEQIDEGSDRVYSTVDHTLSDNIERLILQGEGNLNGTGNSLNNNLYGNTGANVLSGGAGHDRLYGQGGDDTLIGGEGNDRLYGQAGSDSMEGGVGSDYYYVDNVGDSVIEQNDEGSDRVYSTVDYILGDNIERLTLQGEGNLNGTGNSLANNIYGNVGANTLAGDAGNDRLYGRGGDDTLVGGAGNDRLYGQAGDDLYQYQRGDGRDTLVELTSEGNDTLQLSGSINHDQLWFSQQGNHLKLQVIGTDDQITINNWYAVDGPQLETIIATDGLSLTANQVEQLVSAMAAFSPPANGELTLPDDIRDQLAPTLAASWG